MPVAKQSARFNDSGLDLEFSRAELICLCESALKLPYGEGGHSGEVFDVKFLCVVFTDMIDGGFEFDKWPKVVVGSLEILNSTANTDNVSAAILQWEFVCGVPLGITIGVREEFYNIQHRLFSVHHMAVIGSKFVSHSFRENTKIIFADEFFFCS